MKVFHWYFEYLIGSVYFFLLFFFNKKKKKGILGIQCVVVAPIPWLAVQMPVVVRVEPGGRQELGTQSTSATGSRDHATSALLAVAQALHELEAGIKLGLEFRCSDMVIMSTYTDLLATRSSACSIFPSHLKKYMYV